MGNSGDYGESWPNMHSRVTSGLERLLDYYDNNKASQQPSQQKIVQQPTTLIVVSHGAACNPLLGSLLHIPILSVIGLASYCVLSALFGSSYQHNISNNNPKQSSATKALKPFRNSKWTLVNRKHKSIGKLESGSSEATEEEEEDSENNSDESYSGVEGLSDDTDTNGLDTTVTAKENKIWKVTAASQDLIHLKDGAENISLVSKSDDPATDSGIYFKSSGTNRGGSYTSINSQFAKKFPQYPYTDTYSVISASGHSASSSIVAPANSRSISGNSTPSAERTPIGTPFGSVISFGTTKSAGTETPVGTRSRSETIAHSAAPIFIKTKQDPDYSRGVMFSIGVGESEEEDEKRHATSGGEPPVDAARRESHGSIEAEHPPALSFSNSTSWSSLEVASTQPMGPPVAVTAYPTSAHSSPIDIVPSPAPTHEIVPVAITTVNVAHNSPPYNISEPVLRSVDLIEHEDNPGQFSELQTSELVSTDTKIDQHPVVFYGSYQNETEKKEKHKQLSKKTHKEDTPSKIQAQEESARDSPIPKIAPPPGFNYSYSYRKSFESDDFPETKSSSSLGKKESLKRSWRKQLLNTSSEKKSTKNTGVINHFDGKRNSSKSQGHHKGENVYRYQDGITLKTTLRNPLARSAASIKSGSSLDESMSSEEDAFDSFDESDMPVDSSRRSIDSTARGSVDSRRSVDSTRRSVDHPYYRQPFDHVANASSDSSSSGKSSRKFLSVLNSTAAASSGSISSVGSSSSASSRSSSSITLNFGKLVFGRFSSRNKTKVAPVASVSSLGSANIVQTRLELNKPCPSSASPFITTVDEEDNNNALFRFGGNQL